MGNREWGMGNGGIGYYLLVIGYWLLVIGKTNDNAQFPMPNSQFPITNSQSLLHWHNLNINFGGNFGVKLDFSFVCTSFANFG